MPAVTFRPSDSIAIANCLASISVGNDFVSLGRGAEEKRSFGVSTETNQWLVNLYLAIMTAMAALNKRKECNARTLFDNDPNLWVGMDITKRGRHVGKVPLSDSLTLSKQHHESKRARLICAGFNWQALLKVSRPDALRSVQLAIFQSYLKNGLLH